MRPSAKPFSVGSYVLVYGALIGFTALTTGVAFVNLGAMNTVAALAIAVAKMLLIVLFFMHARHSDGLTRVVMCAGVLWLAILIALTLADFRTRGWSPNPSGWGAENSVHVQPPQESIL